MTTTLILARHGEALPATIDPEAPLSERGKIQTLKVAALLKPLPFCPKEVWHSQKLRAKQTAHLFYQELNLKTSIQEKEGLKPNDSPLDLVHTLDNINYDLLIVSHLPFLPKVVATLLTHSETPLDIAFLPSTCVVMQKQEGLWSLVAMVGPILAEEA